MTKTNGFHIGKMNDNKIIVEEERKEHSPFALFFIKNGRLIFAISLLFSVTVFIIAFALTLSNFGESSVVRYESNGVNVTFKGDNNSILNGTPITSEYASMLFNSNINIDSSDVGVVIILKEVSLNDRTIVFYSDKTALIKYNTGGYMRVSSVNGEYGVNDDGVLNTKASVKKLSGKLKVNDRFGISMIYLSDGSMEVTKDDNTFFIRNGDVTISDTLFYTNLSGVSLPISRESNRVYYSDGTIKEDNYLVVENTKYNIRDEKTIFDNIKIIYYDNGYGEIVKDNMSIMVRNSGHIVYTDNSLEIIDNSIKEIEIKDLMDIKEIEITNTNTTYSNYIVVLEETNNYEKYDVNKRLDNKFINYNVYVNGEKIENNVLDNNLKGSDKLEGLSLNGNTYLIYEGTLEKLSTTNFKMGMWISYENITNEYMNAAFIGTIKVYVETLD